MIIKTLSLKIDNPTKAKAALMDGAFTRYTGAFQALLDALRERLAALEQQQIRPNKFFFLRLIDGAMLDGVAEYEVEPFKDSLKLDVAMTMAAYYGRILAGRTASFPVARLGAPELARRINRLSFIPCNRKRMKHKLYRTMDKFDRIRPLFFCRYDTARNYCLLYDPAKRRFYAKLYLLNNKNALRSASEQAHTPRPLSYIADGMPPYERGGKCRYILVPLAFGQWQEAYLQKALADPSLLKSAQLIKRGGDYYLNVKMACEHPEPIKTSAYMSVTRSLQAEVTACVVDAAGEEVRAAPVPAVNLPSRLHCLANDIVAAAREHAAQLVVYKLQGRGDHAAFADQKAVLSAGDYVKLCALLAYKAPLAGLPTPVFVSPGGVFTTCPVCGRNTAKNRRSDTLFLCVSCGYGENVETLAARNLAKRLLLYGANKITVDVLLERDTLTYENKALGLRFSCANDRMASNKFFAHLKKHLASLKPESANQASIARKLCDAANPADAIRFRQLEG